MITAIAGRHRIVTADGELAHARDFDSYGAQMDASLQNKLDDLRDWIVPGRIVDKGCGTGKLLVELSRMFPDSAFVGVDLSREFLRRCDENAYVADDVAFVHGDARDPAVEPGTATTVVFSSIMHEVWTYTGYSRAAVERALASAFADLAPGGRILVRDGLSPGRTTWRMTFLDDDVAAVFARFAVEYKHGAGAPFERIGPRDVRMSAHLANEFLCKKDYQVNWHIEVHEEFATFTLDEWTELMTAAGFRVEAIRPVTNEWIVNNRYVGAVALADDGGTALPWPATNVVVVGAR